MPPPFVLPLSRSTEPSLVGGKAASLARLIAAGVYVPDGCCVTTHAYEHCLASLGFAAADRWRDALRRSGDERREDLRRCREIIRRSQLEGLVAMLLDVLAANNGIKERRWAVRSSATNEDTAHASAAGLYHTALDVRWASIAGGITDVWASLWEERVVEYMLNTGRDDAPPAMAVIVQPLLQAAIAGVATSIDPVTGHARHVTINAVHGLGLPLVDGRMAPHQYVVDVQFGRVIRHIAADQHERLVVAAGGIAMEPIPSADRDRPLLSDSRLLEVAALVKRIEEVLRTPVDVEWAVEAERVWTLQARPLTAVSAASEITNDDCEWSRANFKETLPELPSPMGLSFLERFMDIYIVAKYRWLGCRIPSRLSPVRVFAGRPYLNVTLFHVLVAQLGGDPSLNAEHMGGTPVRSAPAVQPLPWSVRLRAGWLMWREMRRVFRRSAGSFGDMKALASRYSREGVRAFSLAEAQDRLVELGRWLDSREVTFGIAAGAGQCLQVFSRILPRWLGTDWRRLLNDSLQGQGTVISAQQIVRIAELVQAAGKDPVACHVFRAGWTPGHYRRSFGGSPFVSAFDRYLEDYGHRGVGESDIMSARLADQPEALLHVIKSQLEGASATLEQISSRQEATRKHALAAIRARCGRRLDRWLIFRWWHRRLSRFFSLREANRHHLMWYSLAARHLLLRAGELLADRGVLVSAEDIFFLRLEELEALDDASTDTWANRIEKRRAEREQWTAGPAPDVIRSWEDPVDRLLNPPLKRDLALHGLPISSGMVTGPVRFVKTTADWSRIRSGDIIVAPVIDPGMAPLFGIAGGLIVEMGGTLSHGAIIAREYGLPAIANVSRAMSLLSENEEVTLDAAKGIVRREKAASGP
ncbi:MAG TPA: PEP/pyruvate-binding domain-containing protein [Nitrospira sp.]|nr:PEP/pyruvate-binding domain-containing protein [Nitrospira sp.]